MTFRWYWLKFVALPVTLHLHSDKSFLWQRICGVQIGNWFIGAIRGHEADGYSCKLTAHLEGK